MTNNMDTFDILDTLDDNMFNDNAAKLDFLKQKLLYKSQINYKVSVCLHFCTRLIFKKNIYISFHLFL